MKLVTVITSHNSQDYIHGCIMSVIKSTRRPDYLILLDDASTDATAHIARYYFPEDIDVQVNAKNLGYVENMNQALKLATMGNWCHILHADDLVYRHFYESALREADADPGLGLIFTEPQIIGENGIWTGRGDIDLPNRPLPSSRRFDCPEFVNRCARLAPIYFCGTVFKTNGLKAKFDPAIKQLPDHEFWASVVHDGGWAAKQMRCQSAKNPRYAVYGAQYRVHNQSWTTKQKCDLKAWVEDEWRVMRRIHGKLRSNGRLHLNFLKLVFAARSAVKAKEIYRSIDDHPCSAVKETLRGRANEVMRITRECVGPFWTELGRMAALARKAS